MRSGSRRSPSISSRLPKRGDVSTVNYLLDLGVDVNGRDEQGTTALTAAAWEGQTEVVRILLERGAEIDPQDELAGMTPLIWACWKGYGDTVGVLVEAGADVNLKDKNDRGGLMGAAWEGRTRDRRHAGRRPAPSWSRAITRAPPP